MDENRKKLYDQLSANYDMGTFDEFDTDLDNEANQKVAWEAMGGQAGYGDFSMFQQAIQRSPQAEEAGATVSAGNTGNTGSADAATMAAAAPMMEPQQPAQDGTMPGEDDADADISLPDAGKPTTPKDEPTEDEEIVNEPDGAAIAPAGDEQQERVDTVDYSTLSDDELMHNMGVLPGHELTQRDIDGRMTYIASIADPLVQQSEYEKLDKSIGEWNRRIERSTVAAREAAMVTSKKEESNAVAQLNENSKYISDEINATLKKDTDVDMSGTSEFTRAMMNDGLFKQFNDIIREIRSNIASWPDERLRQELTNRTFDNEADSMERAVYNVAIAKELEARSHGGHATTVGEDNFAEYIESLRAQDPERARAIEAHADGYDIANRGHASSVQDHGDAALDDNPSYAVPRIAFELLKQRRAELSRRMDALKQGAPGGTTIAAIEAMGYGEMLTAEDYDACFRQAEELFGRDKIQGYNAQIMRRHDETMGEAVARYEREVMSTFMDIVSDDMRPKNNWEYVFGYIAHNNFGSRVLQGLHGALYGAPKGLDFSTVYNNSVAQYTTANSDGVLNVAAQVFAPTATFLLGAGCIGEFVVPNIVGRWTSNFALRAVGGGTAAGMRSMAQKGIVKYGTSMLSTGTNFAAFGLQNELIHQLSTGDVGGVRLLVATLEEGLKGAAFGGATAIMGKVFERATGWKAYVGEAAKIGVEAAAFTGMGYLEARMNGKDGLTLADVGTNIGIVAGSKMSHFKQWSSEVRQRARNEGIYGRKVNYHEISEREREQLESLGYHGVAIALKGSRLSEDQARAIDAELSQMRNDKNVPWELVRCADWVLNGRMSVPPAVADARVDGDAVNGYVITAVDSTGRAIRGGVTVKGNDAKNAMVRLIKKEADVARYAAREQQMVEAQSARDQAMCAQQFCAMSDGKYTDVGAVLKVFGEALRKVDAKEKLGDVEEEVLTGVGVLLAKMDMSDIVGDRRKQAEQAYKVNLDKAIKKDASERTDAEKAAVKDYDAWLDTNKDLLNLESEQFAEWLRGAGTDGTSPWSSASGDTSAEARGWLTSWSDKIDTSDLVIVESIDQVADATVREAIKASEREGRKDVPGWSVGGKAYVYLPHIGDKADFDKTVMHELVAHRGLRGLLGENRFNDLCDRVWNSMSAADRARLWNYPSSELAKNERDRQRAVADEYIAQLSERTDAEGLHLWNKFVALLYEHLHVNIMGTGLDAQLREDIRESYRNLREQRGEQAEQRGEGEQRKEDPIFEGEPEHIHEDKPDDGAVPPDDGGTPPDGVAASPTAEGGETPPHVVEPAVERPTAAVGRVEGTPADMNDWAELLAENDASSLPVEEVQAGLELMEREREQAHRYANGELTEEPSNWEYWAARDGLSVPENPGANVGGATGVAPAAGGGRTLARPKDKPAEPKRKGSLPKVKQNEPRRSEQPEQVERPEQSDKPLNELTAEELDGEITRLMEYFDAGGQDADGSLDRRLSELYAEQSRREEEVKEPSGPQLPERPQLSDADPANMSDTDIAAEIETLSGYLNNANTPYDRQLVERRHALYTEQDRRSERAAETPVEVLRGEFSEQIGKSKHGVELDETSIDDGEMELTGRIKVDGEDSNVVLVHGEGDTPDSHWNYASVTLPGKDYEELSRLAGEFNRIKGRDVAREDPDALRLNFTDIDDAIEFDRWAGEHEQEAGYSVREGETFEEYEKRVDNPYKPDSTAALYVKNKYADRWEEITRIVQGITPENAELVGRELSKIIERDDAGKVLLTVNRGHVNPLTVLPFIDGVSKGLKDNSTQPASQPQESDAVPENRSGEAAAQVDAEAERRAAQEADPYYMPMENKGGGRMSPNWRKATAEQIFNHLNDRENESGRGTLDGNIADGVKRAEDKLKAVERREPKGKGRSDAALDKWEKELSEARAQLEKWREVERMRREQKAADGDDSDPTWKQAYDEFNSSDEEPVNLEDYVARHLYGTKFKWKDKEFENTGGRTHGLGGHLGLSKSDKERRGFFGWIDEKNGSYPESVAEGLYANMPDWMRERYDTMEVLDAVLSVVGSNPRPRDMVVDYVKRLREQNRDMDEYYADEAAGARGFHDAGEMDAYDNMREREAAGFHDVAAAGREADSARADLLADAQARLNDPNASEFEKQAARTVLRANEQGEGGTMFRFRDDDEIKAKATDLLRELRRRGLTNFIMSESRAHGLSVYVQDLLTGTKFRLSDHGVTSNARLKNEIHVNADDNISELADIAEQRQEAYDEHGKQFEQYKAGIQETRSYWDGIKSRFDGDTFVRMNRTYQDMETIKRKHPEARDIMQKDLGGGAYRYEWHEPKQENSMTVRPSFEYMDWYRTNADGRGVASTESTDGGVNFRVREEEERDREYADAVAAGDKKKVDRMLRDEAERKLNETLMLPDDSDVIGFKYHRGPAPKKTRTMYAVLNVSGEGLRAAYAGNKASSPIGVWLDAVPLKSYASDYAKNDDGTPSRYVPGDTGKSWNTLFSEETYAKMMAEDPDITKSTKWLYERGGKHGTDVPNFSQMNKKDPANAGTPEEGVKTSLPHNKLIFEIECGMDENGDMTEYVKENGRFVKGKNQGLDWVGENKFYFFKTNPNAFGNWGIAGTFRIKRLVPYEEVVTETAKANEQIKAENERISQENAGKPKSKQKPLIKEIPLQRWIGGYHPEDSGITVESIDALYERGKQMKLLEPTYDDNGNLIPLSQRFDVNKNDIRFRARDDDERREQTHSENFKRWFGDWENDPENASKVVDANGEPLVVYHGTKGQEYYWKDGHPYTRNVPKFYTFKSGFFTPDREAALVFADGAEHRVYATYLDIKRPLEIDAHGDSFEEIRMPDGSVMSTDRIVEQARQIGDYDGVIIRNVSGESNGNVRNTIDDYIPFRPEQIKSATENNGDFSRGNGDIRFRLRDDERRPTFYSNAERAVENVKQGKATAEQWKAMLTKAGGIKAGEDKWMGLTDWLDEHKGQSLTKDEVLQFVRDNGIRMEEVNYGGDEQDRWRRIWDNLSWDELYDTAVRRVEERGGDSEEWDYINAEIQDILTERYGEQVFDHIDYDSEGNIELKGNEIHSIREDYTTPGLENKREIAFVVPGIEPYQQGDAIHFGPENEGKAVMWVRFGETTDADGKRVLVIDEIQSNRHQDAREKGYRDRMVKERYEQAQKAYNDYGNALAEKYNVPKNFVFTSANDAERKQLRSLLEAEQEAHRAYKESYGVYSTAVPAAPFEKNWHEVAMKRMLRLAADEGFDKVAWTTGEQQADRYNMESSIGKIYASKTGDLYHLEVYKPNGEELRMQGMIGDSRSSGDFTKEQLKQAFGSAAANEIVSAVEKLPHGEEVEKLREEHQVQQTRESLRKYRAATTAEIDGKDLFKGEGMKGFYDEILPRFMNKYGKKWGSQVGDVKLSTPGGEVMHSVDVTEPMKESVMQGQPLFRVRRAPNGKESNLDERQYDEVRTGNFKRWFGDWENDPENASKVVDENGEPLVVYHGSGENKFNVFEHGDVGYHFGNYDQAMMRNYMTVDYEGIIRPFYLDIKNPLLLEGDARDWNGAGLADFLLTENDITDGTGAFSLRQRAGAEYNPFKSEEDIARLKEISAMREAASVEESNKAMRDFLEEKGYDGIKYLNEVEVSPDGKDNYSYIAFRPEQIKSATGNNGEFSRESGDIRFRIRGEHETGDRVRVRREGMNDGRVRVDGLPGEWRNIDEAGRAMQLSDPEHMYVPSDDGKWLDVYDWRDNEVWNIWRGKPGSKRFEKWRERTLNHIRKQVPEYAKKLGLDVELIDDEAAVPAGHENEKSWYDAETGKIHIVVPRHAAFDVSDVMSSLWHEGVSRHGLRKLVGDDNYDTFLDNVYATSDANIRAEIDRLTEEVTDGDRRGATEEYLSRLAEQMGFQYYKDGSVPVRSWMQRGLKVMRENFDKLCRHLGMLDVTETLRDDDLRAVLYDSYHHLLAENRDAYAAAKRAEREDKEYVKAVKRGDIDTAMTMLHRKLAASEGIVGYAAAHGHGGNHREVSHRLKDSESGAIEQAARDMAQYVPKDAVLVPMPPHEGVVRKDTDTWLLAQELSRLTGAPVVAALRGRERESRYAAKQAGRKGPSADELGFYQDMELPEGKTPVFVDNVVGSGETAKAAVQAMGGRGMTLAYTKGNLGKPTEGLKNVTVTYDDAGNLIPLSERFDRSNSDVRFRFVGERGAGRQDAADGGERMRNKEIAEAMERGGKDARAIKLATGWERGKDGKWRHEERDFDEVSMAGNLRWLADNPDAKRYLELLRKSTHSIFGGGAALSPDERKELDQLRGEVKGIDFSKPLRNADRLTLEDFVRDDRLFSAYPELRDVHVELVDDKDTEERGHYSESDATIVDLLNPDTESKTNRSITLNTHHLRNLDDFKKTLAHEVQHAVQAMEGFARGDDPARYDDLAQLRHDLQEDKYELTDINAKLEAAADLGYTEQTRMGRYTVAGLRERKEKLEARIKTTEREIENYIEPYDRYRRATGEVEARNVSERMDMTDEQRRGSLASDTEDVARDEQIVRFRVRGDASGETADHTTAVEDARRRLESDDASEFERTAARAVIKAYGGGSDDAPDTPGGGGPRFRIRDDADMLVDMTKHNNEVARKRRDAVTDFVKAITDVDELTDSKFATALGKVMRGQRQYDQATVADITTMVKAMMDAGLLTELDNFSVKQILTKVKDSTGKNDITAEANKLIDIMLKHQLRRGKRAFEQQLKVKGMRQDSRGVVVQGGLDYHGQRAAKALKEGLSLGDLQAVNDRIDEAEQRLSDPDEVVRGNAADELEGLYIARQYYDEIKQSEINEANIKSQLEQAQADHKNGTLSDEAYKQLRQASNDALRELRCERVDAWARLNEQLSGSQSESAARAKQFREQQKQRQAEIQHWANSDMEGHSADPHEQETRKKSAGDKARDVAQAVLQPLGTFDKLMRYFGNSHPKGEGYLFGFMRRFMNVRDQWFKERKADFDQMDTAARSIGAAHGARVKVKLKDGTIAPHAIRDWADVYTYINQQKPLTVTVKGKDYEITQGNATYLLAMEGQADGRMKLRTMGLTEADMDALRGQVDPMLLELSQWVIHGLLPGMRPRLNATHLRMFGADMTDIPNYFPIRTSKLARNETVNLAQQNGKIRPATITGSIIERKRNNLDLDLGADFFQVTAEHVDEMNHWNSFAEFARDLNTLLSYKRFKAQVHNLHSWRYGNGADIWQTLEDTAAITTGDYQPKTSKADAIINGATKGLAAANITFRPYTGLKQLLSSPVYLVQARWDDIGYSLANLKGTWQWAIKNLPTFAERWQGRMAGDPILTQAEQEHGSQNKKLRTLSKWGFAFNAGVDAVTVAIGARAIYRTKYRRYKDMGYSDEQANQKALEDASISVNETQQSGLGAFTSVIQQDRTFWSRALTIYRNASMGYQRQLVEGLKAMRNGVSAEWRATAKEKVAKKLERDGIDSAMAAKVADRLVNREAMRGVALAAMFGSIAPFVWALGAQYLGYKMAGGDDDEQEDKMLGQASTHLLSGWVEGIVFGGQLSSAADFAYDYYHGRKKLRDYSLQRDLVSDMAEQILGKSSGKPADAVYDIVNMLVAMGTGVNPKSIVEPTVGIIDVVQNWGGDAKLAHEVALGWCRLLNVPQTSLDQVYIDEIGLSAKDAKQLSAEEFAERWCRYKRRRGAGWMSALTSAESDAEQEGKLLKRYERMMDERFESLSDERVEQIMRESDDELLKKHAAKAYKSRIDALTDDEVQAAIVPLSDSAPQDSIATKREGIKRAYKSEGMSYDTPSDREKNAQAYERRATMTDIAEDAALKGRRDALKKSVGDEFEKMGAEYKKGSGGWGWYIPDAAKDRADEIHAYKQAHEAELDEYGILSWWFGSNKGSSGYIKKGFTDGKHDADEVMKEYRAARKRVLAKTKQR